MENEDIIVTTIKIFFIVFFSMLINIKILNGKICNKREVIISIISSIVLAIIYTIIKFYIDTILALCILYILMSISIKLLNTNKILFSMLGTLISMAICFICWGLAVIAEYPIHKMLDIKSNFINIILINAIEGFILLILFRIKRFKNGLDFFKNKIDNDYTNVIMMNISAIIIMGYSIVGNYYGNLTRHLLLCFIILGIIMIIIILKTLELYYKQKLLNETIEDYKNEIKEKDETIKKLSDEKFNISKINHEFYNRQKALELKVKEMALEAGEEFTVLDRINNLTKEYSEDLQKIKGKPKLPLTDISEIDDMFKYMQTECYNSNIDFKLQVEGNIHYLINNIIPKNKLETLIGDHIKDAIIAINSSNNKYKSILAILGIKEDCYEFCVYDTGIEFEIETLLKLGIERITTHKEEGRKRNRIYNYF